MRLTDAYNIYKQHEDFKRSSFKHCCTDEEKQFSDFNHKKTKASSYTAFTDLPQHSFYHRVINIYGSYFLCNDYL